MYQFSLHFRFNWPPFPLILKILTPHFYNSLDPIGSIIFSCAVPGYWKFDEVHPPQGMTFSDVQVAQVTQDNHTVYMYECPWNVKDFACRGQHVTYESHICFNDSETSLTLQCTYYPSRLWFEGDVTPSVTLFMVVCLHSRPNCCIKVI